MPRSATQGNGTAHQPHTRNKGPDSKNCWAKKSSPAIRKSGLSDYYLRDKNPGKEKKILCLGGINVLERGEEVLKAWHETEWDITADTTKHREKGAELGNIGGDTSLISGTPTGKTIRVGMRRESGLRATEGKKKESEREDITTIINFASQKRP